MSALHGRTRRPLIAHTGTHRGPWRPRGGHHAPRHAAGTFFPDPGRSLVAQVAPAPTLAALVAPPLAVRPIAARPRGPQPYEIAPPTQPLALTTGATS